MPTTSYYTVGGEILGERVPGGSRRNYGVDALGSVTSTMLGDAVENRYSYKPYGDELSRSGAGSDPAFRWVGSLGYKRTGRSYAEEYVRARHYGTKQGAWTTVDPLWPGERAYAYVNGSVTVVVDPGGLAARIRKPRPSINPPKVDDTCTKEWTGTKFQNDCISNFCNALNDARVRAIQRCIDQLHVDYKPLPELKIECLQSWCTSGKDIRCIECTGEIASLAEVRCDSGPCRGQIFRTSSIGGYTDCGGTNNIADAQINMCTNAGYEYFNKKCPGSRSGGGTPGLNNADFRNSNIMHELGHACTGCKLNETEQDVHQPAFKKFGKCITSAVGCKESWY